MPTDRYSHYFSENIRFARSQTMTLAADDTYNLMRIPHWAFVCHVFLQIITPYTGGGSPVISVGYVGNGGVTAATAFLATTDITATSAGIYGKDAPVYFDAGSGVVTVTTAATGATGLPAFRIFVDYSVLH